MILQYQGYKNNWCYEEADTVSHANVYLGDVTKISSEKPTMTLEEARNLEDNIINKIVKETHFSNDIHFHVGDLIMARLKNVCCVEVQNKGKPPYTRVFSSSVDYPKENRIHAFILNNDGKTVVRL